MGKHLLQIYDNSDDDDDAKIIACCMTSDGFQIQILTIRRDLLIMEFLLRYR